jgi:hypothetical protein
MSAACPVLRGQVVGPFVARLVPEICGRGAAPLTTEIAEFSEVAEMVRGTNGKLAMLLRALRELRDLGVIALIARVHGPSGDRLLARPVSPGCQFLAAPDLRPSSSGDINPLALWLSGASGGQDRTRSSLTWSAAVAFGRGGPAKRHGRIRQLMGGRDPDRSIRAGWFEQTPQGHAR